MIPPTCRRHGAPSTPGEPPGGAPLESTTEPRRRFRLAELTREELRRRLPDATVVIPIGATEQHGPHLPLMTDHLMAETIALRAAGLVPPDVDVLVAPVLPFGCSSHHLQVGGRSEEHTS